MPKTNVPGGRNAVAAARQYRDQQNTKHRANLKKVRANLMFKWMTGLVR